MVCFRLHTTQLINEIYFIKFVTLKYFLLKKYFYVILFILIYTKILIKFCKHEKREIIFIKQDFLSFKYNFKSQSLAITKKKTLQNLVFEIIVEIKKKRQKAFLP